MIASQGIPVPQLVFGVGCAFFVAFQLSRGKAMGRFAWHKRTESPFSFWFNIIIWSALALLGFVACFFD